MLKGTIKRIYELLTYRPIRFSSYHIKLHELFSYNEREKLLLQIMDYVRSNRLEGDYLEFGIYRGGTLIPAYHFSKAIGKNLKIMKFYGFDSFEGLPEVKGLDKKNFPHFRKGDYKGSLEEVKSLLKKSKVDLKRVRLIKGWFNSSLNKEFKENLPIKKAAIIWIDCDLYESTVQVLNFIKDYLQNGTIVVFDDWFCFRGNPEQGEQKAFSEWLKKNKNIKAIELRRSYWGGMAFLIRLKKIRQ